MSKKAGRRIVAVRKAGGLVVGVRFSPARQDISTVVTLLFIKGRILVCEGDKLHGRCIVRHLIHHTYMWQHWVNGILGLWILISPFVGLEGSSMTTNLVIVGIVVAILGFWSAAMGKKSSMPM